MQSKSSPIRFERVATIPDSRRRSTTARSLSPIRQHQRWSGPSWTVSIALFAVPAILVLATLIVPRMTASPQFTVHVTDRLTGQGIPQAAVTYGDQSVSTDAMGAATFRTAADQVDVTIASPGYEAMTTSVGKGSPTDWQVALRPNVLRGRVTNAESQAAIPDTDVVLSAPDGAGQSTKTDQNGLYQFNSVPEGASIRFSSPEFAMQEQSVGELSSLDVSLSPTVITGNIVDPDGKPVAGARVATMDGSVAANTGADGTFRLASGANVDTVVVSASGFADQVVAVDDSRTISAQLGHEMIRAIYANIGVLGDPERWNRLIEIADTTEINAIVVDVKQDTIYYDTQVPFFRDIDGMVVPVFDPQTLLAQLDEHGIYSIARMVVFKDPVVAEARPDLAVRNEDTGDLWRDMNGAAWVNAFNEELWQANADLGAELASLGFDEVQYDYIRFPSDGDLTTTDFGRDYSEANRRAAITGAVAIGAKEVHAAGAHFAVDLFPIVALMGDDQGIGQTVQDLAPLVDYVCLMIYPSHFETGNIPVDGPPNDFPAETVTYTLQKTEELIPGSMSKMRPWLQDFTYPLEGYSAYGPDEVRAQIDAAEAMGVSGWLLWNAAGEFEVAALSPK
jgi:hypothetical protein